MAKVNVDYGEIEAAVTAIERYCAEHRRHNRAMEEEILRLAAADNAVGFLLPPMAKHSLFRGVIAGGVLPRKTFSMGHAREKRYYLEGRKIK